MQLSDIIKIYCNENNLSIPELAQKIGMSFSGLYSALKSETLKVKTLKKIAEVLGVHVTEFFTQTAMIPDRNFVYTSFVKDPSTAILCKRYNKFSEKLSFYMDDFFLYIFPSTDHHMQEEDMRMHLLYPFKHETRPKFIFKRKNKSVYPKIPNIIRELPFSQWPGEYKQQIKENKFLLESFYFPVFHYNLLNITDYLNEGIIEDKELVSFWNEWKKIEKETKIVKTPLFIDVYTDKPVYYDED